MKKLIFVVLLLLLSSCALAAPVTLPIDLSGGFAPQPSGFLSDTSYEDASIRVDIETTEYLGTACYLARIRIQDGSQLRTAPAYDFSRLQTAPSAAIAERVNAVLAINGDFYSYQMESGSFLVRQGILYANKPLRNRDVLLVDANGDFTIVPPNPDGSPKTFSPEGVVNAFNFGPGLIVDGKPMETGFNSHYNYSEEKHRRCAIAQVRRGEHEYLCIVTDGPEEKYKTGLTMKEFTDFVATLGVENCYNLDGGNSTVMFFGGRKINAIAQRRLRPISDIIYFASADDGK